MLQKRILQVARNALSENEQVTEAMDISDMCGTDMAAAKREANRQMVREGTCWLSAEPKKTGRRPKFA